MSAQLKGYSKGMEVLASAFHTFPAPVVWFCVLQTPAFGGILPDLHTLILRASRMLNERILFTIPNKRPAPLNLRSKLACRAATT